MPPYCIFSRVHFKIPFRPWNVEFSYLSLEIGPRFKIGIVLLISMSRFRQRYLHIFFSWVIYELHNESRVSKQMWGDLDKKNDNLASEGPLYDNKCNQTKEMFMMYHRSCNLEVTKSLILLLFRRTKDNASLSFNCKFWLWDDFISYWYIVWTFHIK